jgi:hypothetical protein
LPAAEPVADGSSVAGPAVAAVAVLVADAFSVAGPAAVAKAETRFTLRLRLL